MFIDTHAHLNMPEYSDISEVLNRAKDSGVEAIIDVGYDIPSSKASLKLSSSEDIIFSSVGIHPHDASAIGEREIDEIRKLAAGNKVVAIGETGLDYYRNLSPRATQIEAFRAHVALALELDLPLIVHARDSYDDVLRILHEDGKSRLRGVMHCFSGDKRAAELAIDLGFYISFAGPITFAKASDAREIAKAVPMERILVETDCPYLSPEPKRGGRNEPSYIVHTAKKLAEIKGFPLEELAQRTTINAKGLFSKLKY